MPSPPLGRKCRTAVHLSARRAVVGRSGAGRWGSIHSPALASKTQRPPPLSDRRRFPFSARLQGQTGPKLLPSCLYPLAAGPRLALARDSGQAALGEAWRFRGWAGGRSPAGFPQPPQPRAATSSQRLSCAPFPFPEPMGYMATPPTTHSHHSRQPVAHTPWVGRRATGPVEVCDPLSWVSSL